jgi:hypothetical protein
MILIVGLILLTGAAILYFINPETSGVFPPCVFHELTGLHCPGCGATRAVHSLLHGDIRQALAWNGVLLVLLSGCGAAAFFYGYLYFVKGQSRQPTLPRKLIVAVLIALLVYWALRNLPFQPFTRLAPHEVSAVPSTAVSGESAE